MTRPVHGPLCHYTFVIGLLTIKTVFIVNFINDQLIVYLD